MRDIKLKEVEYESEEFDKLYTNWEEDISHFMPDFDIEDLYFSKVFCVNVDGEPAGMLIYQEKGDQIHVNLDYISAPYRDSGIGKEMFKDLIERFRDTGYKLIVALAYTPYHQSYLKEVGFKANESFKSQYEIALK